MTEREENIKAIQKFVDSVYHPKRTRVRELELEGYSEYFLIFYFDHISDDYIVNHQHKDLTEHKESMFARRIRESIERYLGIKTSGLQSMNNYFSPIENHGISIIVVEDNPSYSIK